jgi:hypothetical protein
MDSFWEHVVVHALVSKCCIHVHRHRVIWGWSHAQRRSQGAVTANAIDVGE